MSWEPGVTVFESEDDVRLFLKTLSEAAQRADLVVHAYVLMPTHYHMLLETPGGNLADGMKWLQVMLAAFIKEHYPLSNRSISKLLSMERPAFISRCRSLAVEKEPDRFKALSLYLRTELGGREK